MSARLQRFPDKRHELPDDMESFYHVLNWCALLCLRHTDAEDIKGTAEFMSMMYDFVSDENPERGHSEKLNYMADGRPFVKFGLLQSGQEHPLTWVLTRLADLFKSHYHHVPNPESPNPSLVPGMAAAFHSPAVPLSEPWAKDFEEEEEPDSDERPAANLSHVDGLGAPDPTKSPLLDHKNMLTILWHPLKKSDTQWPIVDRMEKRQIVLGTTTKGKRTSQSHQLNSRTNDSKRSRTGVSPFVQAPSAASRHHRTYASSARAHSRTSKSARGSPAHSDSSTRSGSPITGATSALSALDLQEQSSSVFTSFSAYLASRGRQPPFVPGQYAMTP